MNCGYCGRKCDLDKDFCIPQDSVYVCKSCYKWQNRVADLESKLAEKEKEIEKLKTSLDAIDKYGQYDKDVENLVLLNPENCYSNGHKVVIKTNNQDKIDYAVEQLLDIKEKAFGTR
jgi:predicted RNase H-like nuclease (RuvC/YqgF family)